MHWVRPVIEGECHLPALPRTAQCDGSKPLPGWVQGAKHQQQQERRQQDEQ